MLLLKSLNYFHLVGKLSTSQKQAVVTLIKKEGREIKDLSKIGN